MHQSSTPLMPRIMVRNPIVQSRAKSMMDAMSTPEPKGESTRVSPSVMMR